MVVSLRPGRSPDAPACGRGEERGAAHRQEEWDTVGEIGAGRQRSGSFKFGFSIYSLETNENTFAAAAATRENGARERAPNSNEREKEADRQK